MAHLHASTHTRSHVCPCMVNRATKKGLNAYALSHSRLSLLDMMNDECPRILASGKPQNCLLYQIIFSSILEDPFVIDARDFYKIFIDYYHQSISRNKNNNKERKKEKKLSSFVIRLLYLYKNLHFPTLVEQAPRRHLEQKTSSSIIRSVSVCPPRHLHFPRVLLSLEPTHIYIYIHTTRRTKEAPLPRAKRSNRAKGNRRS